MDQMDRTRGRFDKVRAFIGEVYGRDLHTKRIESYHVWTGHGRAAALLWLSVWKNELKNQRSAYEDTCLQRLSELLPPGCRVTILADRGFGDQTLFAFLDRLGFGYVIRFRGNIHVTAADGQSKPAAAWAGKGGRARKLRDARVTAKGQQVGAVVCVHAKGMKEPWCLASSDGEAMATTLINHYAKRWTIDIDQSWRLSRIKGCVVGSAHRRWQSAPGRRRCPDRLEIGNRRSVGGDQRR